MIGTSDGGARPHSADRHEYSTHLLGHWVRDQQVMTLEEAVYRLTGRTALMHDMYDRGFVSAGKVADLVIFDPDTIASRPREPVNDLPAGGTRVKRDAVGIDYVVVDGTVLLDKGQLTDALPPDRSWSALPGEPRVTRICPLPRERCRGRGSGGPA